MDSSFIPPPFPFPEAWPRVFAEQQQYGERKWLMPTTCVPVQCKTPVVSEYVRLFDETDKLVVNTCCGRQQDVSDDDACESEDDDAFEHRYVLSNEWREHFQSSFQSSRQTKKKKKQNKKTTNQQRQSSMNAATSDVSRSCHLQSELQAAKTRELARKWKWQGIGNTLAVKSTDQQIKALETSLNMRFDDFCDAFQPVLWPHESLG